jgi:small conductance mechanosensitive channel
MDSISADKLMQLFQDYALPLVWAIIIFIVGRLVARIIAGTVAKAMTKSKVDTTLIKFAQNAVYILLMIFVILAAIAKLGIQTTSFAAILAAAGLAIGLSLQGSLGNLAAGIMLILFRPFRVGDYVEAGGTSGTVEEIQIFNTIMTSPDNKEIIVPNGQIIGSTITNYSTKPTRRVDLVIGVSYGDDLKKVRAVLEDILSQEKRILEEPAATIAVLELADSSVNFAVRPWVNAGDYWPVRFELQETIKTRFDEEGITIPFPQQDVHFVQEKAAS